MAMSVEQWAEAYRKAWEDRDAEAAAALFTEDATYRDNIYEDAHQGHEGVAEYWRGVTASQDAVRVVMGRPYGTEERATVEFWTRMTVGGAPVTLAGCLLLDFDGDGRCRALREYWNFADGDHAPPAGWGK